MPFLSRGRISIILTAIAGGLWAHSIVFAEFKIGFYGLIDSFPVTLFVGLGFLTVAAVILWVSKEYHPKLLLCQLLLLISALWLAPAIAGGSAPFTNHALRSLGLVEYIARTGILGGSQVLYLSWPGAFIPPALVSKVFSVNFEPVLNYAPFIMQLLYLAPLYVFLKNTLGEDRRNYCWAGMWLFYLASWGGIAYFASPPSVGLLLLLVLMALITRPSLWEKEGKHYALWASVVVVYGLLAVTHLMTSIVALCILGGIVLLKRNRKVAITVSLCLALLVTWNLTGALPSTRESLRVMDIVMPNADVVEEVAPDSGAGETGGTITVDGEIVPASGIPTSEIIKIPQRPVEVGEGRNFLLSFGLIAEGQIGSHFSGSESHIAVTQTTLLFSGLFAILGIAGAVIALLDKKRREIAIMVLVIAVAPLILVSFSYGGRMFGRLYLVSLIPMAYFGANLVAVKKKAVIIGLCALLALCVPLHIIAHYGNQEVDYVSPEQMEGLHYFHDNTSGGYVIGVDTPWLIENIESYYYRPFYRGRYDGNKMVVPTSWGVLPCWFVITRQDRAYYEFILDAPDFVGEVEELLGRTENCEIVYDTPDFKIYSIGRE